MANKRICVQVDFDGPSPIIINSNGTFDKRTSLVNLARLIRGIDKGAQFRASTAAGALRATTVVVQQTLVQASATATPASVAVNDTLTIGGTALTAKQGRATGTVTPGTSGNVPVADDTVTLNGQVFTAVNGAVVLGEATFDISGNDAAMCASLAAQVNAYGGSKVNGVVKARASSTVVTFYAVQIGTAGNAITLDTNNNTRLAKSGTVLANGAALTNNQFDCKGSNVTTGADIVRAAQASTTAAIKACTYTYSTSTGVVTVTAKAPGVAGNAVTFTSSDGTRLAVTGSGLLASGSAGAPTQWVF